MVGRARFLGFAHDLLRSRSTTKVDSFVRKATLAVDHVGSPKSKGRGMRRASFLTFAHELLRSRLYGQHCHLCLKSFFQEFMEKL